MTWSHYLVVSLTPFAYLLALTSPLSRNDDASSAITSSPFQSRGNSSSTSALYPSQGSGSSLSIPQIPPGFSIDIDHHDAISLRPLGLYVTAVEAMFILSLFPWDALAPHPYTFNVQPYQEEIHFEPISEDQPTKLRHSHMVIGLYVTVLGTAERFGHGFIAETTTLKLWDHPIGICTIYPLPSAAYDVSIVNVSLLNASNGDNGSTFSDVGLKAESPITLTTSVPNPGSDSGSFQDPDDPRVRVHWRYRFLPLASRDVFLAILDGLTLAAREDTNDLCRELTAFSETPQRKVAISVSAIRGTQVALDLTYRHAARTLLLISRLMVRLGKYVEMIFWVEFNGARFAFGDVMRREE